MNLNMVRFIFKIILAEVLLFCFINSILGLADAATQNVTPKRAVTLTWDRNEEIDLAGYYLNYKEDSFKSSPQCIKIEGNVTTYTLHGLDYNKTYVFWASTYDTTGLTSDPSDEVILCHTCYQDNDGDGYGNPDIKIQDCFCPSGYVENSDDYNDSNPRITDGSTDGSTEHVIQVRPGESIQAAINAAYDGDVIIVLSGTYREKIKFNGKAVTVKSSNPNDPSVVASTIIDGSRTGTVITFDKDEKSNSILSGITVRNGKGIYGGGIYCTTSPTIINCAINGNSAKYGGGICCISSSVTIKNCTISGNTANYGGAGIYCVMSPAAIIDCTISKNTSNKAGGGINFFLSSSTITNCIIHKNSGAPGGGIYCGNSSPRITNTIIYANSTSSYGGGGIHCTATSNSNITNCVISGNSARFYGGGICHENCSLTITNCLFWRNTPGEIYNKTNWTYTNINKAYNGNIKADPLFVNPSGGNFHIKPSSPCIDAGTSTGAPEKDKDGHQRPIGKGYDIGAYEFGN